MCVWLGVSYLCNSESVGVHNSLAGRNVQCRLLHQYMCVGWMFPAFVIQNLWVCTIALLEGMCSVGCCTNIFMCGGVFPIFGIQNLWVCSVASLQEMCSVGCCISSCVWGFVFPAFVIQNLWVCTTASLQEMCSIG